MKPLVGEQTLMDDMAIQALIYVMIKTLRLQLKLKD